MNFYTLSPSMQLAPRWRNRAFPGCQGPASCTLLVAVFPKGQRSPDFSSCAWTWASYKWNHTIWVFRIWLLPLMSANPPGWGSHCRTLTVFLPILVRTGIWAFSSLGSSVSQVGWGVESSNAPPAHWGSGHCGGRLRPGQPGSTIRASFGVFRLSGLKEVNWCGHHGKQKEIPQEIKK